LCFSGSISAITFFQNNISFYWVLCENKPEVNLNQIVLRVKL